MPSGLDHIVHAVRDLDAAAEFYFRARIGKADLPRSAMWDGSSSRPTSPSAQP
jgi:hypothetical protein